MDSYTIRQARIAFAEIDKIPVEQHARFDTALRHISQRIYLPAAGRDGRADTYARHTICALRILQKASGFGLDRWLLERIAQWLQGVTGGHSMRQPSGAETLRGLSVIEESERRVMDGEDFDFSVVLRVDGSIAMKTTWRTAPVDHRVSEVLALIPDPVEDARFTFPASRLIRELLAALDD